MTIDFLVHVVAMPDIAVFDVADPMRECQDDPWLDLLMARRMNDPWLAWIGDRDARIPHVKLPTPEEEAREKRGGLEASCTRVGLVYGGRLRAHMQVRAVIRHVEGTFLLLTRWSRFLPVTVRQDIEWFPGWREVNFDKKDMIVSENWALTGLPPVLAGRVRELLAKPPIDHNRAKPAQAQAEAPTEENWPVRERPALPAAPKEERIVIANSNGGSKHTDQARKAVPTKTTAKKAEPPGNGGQLGFF